MGKPFKLVETHFAKFIFGVHDPGEWEDWVAAAGKQGWVLKTEGIGCDPNDRSGEDYTRWINKGLGVIVRLNNGYGPTGTIPHSSQYDNFAQRCANWVAASKGAHIWIIGNEMNLADERPGGPAGETITPDKYANCYLKCRNAIKALSGHEDDQVIIGAVGPWNSQTHYPGNEIIVDDQKFGDWIKYFEDILVRVRGQCDGIAIHAYSHGNQPGLVSDEGKMGHPFENRRFHFRVYRDFMSAIPPDMRGLPVYITEAQPTPTNVDGSPGGWQNVNNGWIQTAFKEINDWNANPNNQPIQALVLFRWQPSGPAEWYFSDKPAVIADFRDALQNDYRVRLPAPPYRLEWLEVPAITQIAPNQTMTGRVVVRNTGSLTWAQAGENKMRLNYKWFDAQGQEKLIFPYENIPLPQNVAPGQSVTFENVQILAPADPGQYTLRWDMVHEGVTPFSAQNAATRSMSVSVQPVAPQYLAEWIEFPTLPTLAPNQTTTVRLTLRNAGTQPWVNTPPNSIHPFYRWFDANNQEVKIWPWDDVWWSFALPRVVNSGETVALDKVLVRAPALPGRYRIVWDMVHDGVTWFSEQGVPTKSQEVNIAAAVPQYGVEWVQVPAITTLSASESRRVRLILRNTGTQPWITTPPNSIHPYYRWFDAQNQEVPIAPWDDVWWSFALPRIVNQGESVTLDNVILRAPATPGQYTLRWDMVHDGVTWFSEQGAATSSANISIVAAIPAVVVPQYAVDWVEMPSLTSLSPGQTTSVRVTLRNAGTQPWINTPPNSIHPYYRWFDAANQEVPIAPWDDVWWSFALPRIVNQGESVTLDRVLLRAPQTPGRYTLVWDMVHDGITWFSDQGAVIHRMPVEITAAPLIGGVKAIASHNAAEAGKAIDGNVDTFWSSGAAMEPNMWFQVDLGETRGLDGLLVRSPGRGFAAGFLVRVSADGQQWLSVARSDKNWKDIQALFAPTQVRYINITQTGQTPWNAPWLISEVLIHESAAWSADASHNMANAGRALDNRGDTSWSTNAPQDNTMWYLVDLGSEQTVTGLYASNLPDQHPRRHLIQVSTDGLGFKTVSVSPAEGNPGPINVTWDGVPARYVVIRLVESAPQPWSIISLHIRRDMTEWKNVRG